MVPNGRKAAGISLVCVTAYGWQVLESSLGLAFLTMESLPFSTPQQKSKAGKTWRFVSFSL